jgi:hypothetical protein
VEGQVALQVGVEHQREHGETERLIETSARDSDALQRSVFLTRLLGQKLSPEDIFQEFTPMYIAPYVTNCDLNRLPRMFSTMGENIHPLEPTSPVGTNVTHRGQIAHLFKPSIAKQTQTTFTARNKFYKHF